MTWSAYREYKDSHVPWLGAIPATWEVAPLKFHLDRNDGGVWGDDPDGTDDTIVLRSTEQTVDGRWAIADPAPRKLSAAEKRAAMLEEDDLLVTKSSGSSLHIGKTTIVDPQVAALRCCYSNFMQRLRTADSLRPKYAWYLMNHRIMREQFDLNSNTTTGLANLNSTILGEARIAIPTPAEQDSILDFLDRETAKIDALIAKQEQLIATLREDRSIAVDLVLDRHGFSPPRRLLDLDSAAVPTGWQIIRLGTLLRQLTNGFVGPTRDILRDEGVPYIQSTHIKQGRIDFDRRPFYVSREWHDQRPRIHLREGDVLIVQTGDIGKVAVVPPGFGDASCHALQIARVKANLVTGTYLGAFLSSWLGYQYLCSLATGALHPHLEAGIRALPVVVPPLDTQAEIVRQVDERIAQIDRLTAKAIEVIEVLREYRSALITDAVTGKIDVRGAV